MHYLLISAAIASIAASAPSNTAIVAGQSIGPINLKAFSSSIERNLGTSTESDAAMGVAWESWTLKKGKISIVIRRTEEGHDYTVTSIRTTSGAFKTEQGIGVGSTIDEIRRQFPSIHPSGTFKLPDSKVAILYDAGKAGIAFEISKDRCLGIVVYELAHSRIPVPEERADWTPVKNE